MIRIAPTPRYSPSRSAQIGPAIIAVLTDEWMNGAAVCAALGRYSDDGIVRHGLRLLAGRGEIERMSTPSAISRTGYAFLFRRKP